MITLLAPASLGQGLGLGPGIDRVAAEHEGLASNGAILTSRPPPSPPSPATAARAVPWVVVRDGAGRVVAMRRLGTSRSLVVRVPDGGSVLILVLPEDQALRPRAAKGEVQAEGG